MHNKLTTSTTLNQKKKFKTTSMACHWLHYIILNTTKCYRLADLQSF